MIFGFMLLNDWSARDIQQWEYVPLGPFQGKAFATSISPWIVTREALEPFRHARPGAGSSAAALSAAGAAAITTTCSSRSACARRDERSGTDLPDQFQIHVLVIGAATDAPRFFRLRDERRRSLRHRHDRGPEKSQRGSLLEISWNGTEPPNLPTASSGRFSRTGIRLSMRGWCQGEGYRVGFGEVEGTICWRNDSPPLKRGGRLSD